MLMLALGSMAIAWMRDDRFLLFGDVDRDFSSFLLAAPAVDPLSFPAAALGFRGAAGFLPSARLVGLVGRSSRRSVVMRNVTPLVPGAILAAGSGALQQKVSLGGEFFVRVAPTRARVVRFWAFLGRKLAFLVLAL